MTAIDQASLDAVLRRLDRIVTGTDLVPTLEQVVEQVAKVFAAEGAGLMFVDDGGALRYVAASDEPGRILERAQEQAGRGPCVDALINDEITATRDVQDDDRWPALRDPLAGSPVHAVLGLPVHVSGAAVGSLNVYRQRPHEWAQDEIHALQAFHHVVEASVASAVAAHVRGTLAEQLQGALDHRVVIERATGWVMASRRLSAVDAFDLLRRTARHQRRKVADVAAELIESGRLADGVE